VLTEFSGRQGRACQREKRVVIALSGGAGVVVDGGLRRSAPDARCSVGGVAHARSGQFCEDSIDGRAGLGIEKPINRRHSVDFLLNDGDAAAFGPVDVGEIAVGVEAVGEFVGQLAQRVGPMIGASGQLRLGLGSGLDVDEVRQPMEEPANHRDLAGTDDSVPLGLCGGRQHRFQRFTVQSPALAEVGGFVKCAAMPRLG